MKEKKLVNFSLVVALLVAVTYVVAQRGVPPPVLDNTQATLTGGIATLYAMDPLLQSLCFADGRAGSVLYENQVMNRCSDISLSYYPDNFTVGVEGGRVGNIIDLGSSAELKERYGYSETVGDNQGFASLHFEEGKVVILKHQGRGTKSMQELLESARLFQEARSAATAPIKLGDIYLARTIGRDKTFPRIVKFKVVAYTPGESVTIRWLNL